MATVAHARLSAAAVPPERFAATAALERERHETSAGRVEGEGTGSKQAIPQGTRHLNRHTDQLNVWYMVARHKAMQVGFKEVAGAGVDHENLLFMP